MIAFLEGFNGWFSKSSTECSEEKSEGEWCMSKTSSRQVSHSKSSNSAIHRGMYEPGPLVIII